MTLSQAKRMPVLANKLMRRTTWETNTPWFRSYIVLVVAAGLFCVLNGTVFTTNEYRPLYSFGALHFASGALVGAISFGLAIWLSFGHKRAWVRRLSWAAFGIVAVEGALGLFGTITPAVRVAHAFLALIFFALSVGIAVLTSNKWLTVTRLPGSRPFLRVLAVLALLATLTQGVLGVAFRHGILGIMPHVLGALVAAVIVVVLAMTVMYGLEHRMLHSVAVTMLIVTAFQVFLGLLLFSISAIVDTEPLIVITSMMIHTATAAVMLAATVTLTLLIWHIVGQDKAEHGS